MFACVMASETKSFTIGCMKHCRLIKSQDMGMPAAMTELKPKYKCDCTCGIKLCKPPIDISHNSPKLGSRRQNLLYGMLHS